MKRFLTSLKRQDGFTLVELMVVVAIIGLLSAVAVPNFKKYQAKAKISEAKLQLSALYTAEASFFSDYNMYAHCLTYMGFDPGPEVANRYYAIGFETIVAYDGTATTGAYGAAVNSGLNQTDCPNSTTVVAGSALGAAGPSGNNASWFPAGKGIGSTMANTVDFLPVSTHADQGSSANMTYTAGAAGVISQDFVTDANSSALTITQAKVLSNVRNGY